jgi:sugar (pentulose or hexulose) kinase
MLLLLLLLSLLLLLLLLQAATYICEYQDYLNYHLTGRMVASISNVSVRWHYNSSRGEARSPWQYRMYVAAACVLSQQRPCRPSEEG